MRPGLELRFQRGKKGTQISVHEMLMYDFHLTYPDCTLVPVNQGIIDLSEPFPLTTSN